MIRIRHRTCGGVAFLYDHLPVNGEQVLSRHAELVDGTKPLPADRIVCGTCHSPIESLSPINLFIDESDLP